MTSASCGDPLAENFDVDLVELAVSAFLGTFARNIGR